jgi:hypothetical protein
MEPGDRQRAAGLDLAGDAFIVDRAFGFQGNDRRRRIGLVTFLDRSSAASIFVSRLFFLPRRI